MKALVRTVNTVPPFLLALAAGVVVLVSPWLGLNEVGQRMVMLTCILALLVGGLNLSLGYAGELALGQAAMYAAGAYITGYLATHGTEDLLVTMAASALAALLVGLLTGAPGLRLGGWSLAMASFFLILLIPRIISMFEEQTGGHVGLIGIPDPTLLGTELEDATLYLAVTVTTLVWFVVLRNLIASRHGVAFRVLRQSPVLASSLGIPVYRMKLTAYAIGAIPAGMAGCLFAYVDAYLSPETFGFNQTVTILSASILGGSTSIYGAFIGAAIMQFGPLRSTDFQQYALVVYGVFLILAGVLLPDGIAGVLRRARRWVNRWAGVTPPAAASTGAQLDALPGAELAVGGMSKQFGGNQALGDVSLTARAGRITAVIGPNGSGKTTLLNVICGFYRADAGAVDVGGHRLPPAAPHRVARAGIARTFQTPVIPHGVTVAEAVGAGRYTPSHVGMGATVLRLPGYRRVHAADRAAVRTALELVGIAELAEEEAASLPLGTRRLLEVARVLVSQPKVLLLDEVASGLDEDEVDRLAALIRRIRDAGGTVILVEHNFRLVLALADEIHVLAQGSVIASGPPEEIEHHPAVLSEYLGVAHTGDPTATEQEVQRP